SGIAVCDAGDHHPQCDLLGLPSQKTECRVALEARILCASDLLHLKEMILDGEHRRTAVFGGLGRQRQGRAQLRRVAGQIIDKVYAQFHWGSGPFSLGSAATALIATPPWRAVKSFDFGVTQLLDARLHTVVHPLELSVAKRHR